MAPHRPLRRPANGGRGPTICQSAEPGVCHRSLREVGEVLRGKQARTQALGHRPAVAPPAPPVVQRGGGHFGHVAEPLLEGGHRRERLAAVRRGLLAPEKTGRHARRRRPGDGQVPQRAVRELRHRRGLRHQQDGVHGPLQRGAGEEAHSDILRPVQRRGPRGRTCHAPEGVRALPSRGPEAIRCDHSLSACELAPPVRRALLARG
mmetsp:Transcript_134938/g.419309  ORF Transcript_134938/g.419309 Transcript_134938/m.419309 type:complete len:206 (-) Transcript_134938:162-779(-)